MKQIGDASVIVMNDRSSIELLTRQCTELLFEKSNGEMKLSQFLERYTMLYDDCPNLLTIRHELSPAIIVCNISISLVIFC